MRHQSYPRPDRHWQPAKLHWVLLGLMSLLLCSCRSLTPLTSWPFTTVLTEENVSDEQPPAAAANPTPPTVTPAAPRMAPPVTTPGTLPGSAWSGYPPHPATSRPLAVGGGGQTWAPPGLPRPWPRDEYIFDGGDRAGQVNVGNDWSVHGLDEEDTVVHYETRSGKTLVQPTNRVPVYAPRFVTVRRIDGIIQNEHTFGLLSNRQVQRLRRNGDIQHQSGLTQQLQPQRHLALATPNGFRDRLPDRSVASIQNAEGTNNSYDLYEDFSIIRRGVFDNNEKPRLNQRIQAAKAWTTQQGLQVLIDDKLPTEFSSDSSSASHSVYQMPEGKQRLRVIKVASQQQAHSGDIIEFTIRFDNTGNETVGNVTVIDNLTPRLEYVPESQHCNLKSNFATQENVGQSLVLRWEIIAPLKVGEGGVIRFKCRVR